MQVRLHVVLTLAVALAAAALVAAGCGSDDKPEYCSNVSVLKQSVDDLQGVELESGALPALQVDVQNVQGNVDAVVSSAKEDFPSETSALESSVSRLSTSVEQLPPDPTRRQLVALTPQIIDVGTASQGLESATSSACD